MNKNEFSKLIRMGGTQKEFALYSKISVAQIWRMRTGRSKISLNAAEMAQEWSKR
jgi:hypothetical protein